MSRYPRPARDIALKCIPCNAPIVLTTAGRFVCVECGNSPIRRRSPRTVTVERDGVRVEKTIDIQAGSAPRLGFTFESSRDDEVVVSVSDELPSSASFAAVAIEPSAEAGGWHQSGSRVACARRIAPRESLETVLYLPTNGVDREALATRPTVEVVGPVDADSGDGSGSTLDGERLVPNGGSSREVVLDHSGANVSPTTGGATSRVDGELPGESTPGYAANQPSGARPEVLAAIPAFNESGAIAEVVGGADDLVDEVMVVDDGSSDDTAVRAARAGATVIEHDRNRGYGATLRTIFREAHQRGADRLVVLDADGQHDPREIPKLVEAQRASGAELVIGSRFVEGSETELPRYRKLGIAVINFLTNLSMGVILPGSYVSDTQSGFRLYDAHAIETLAFDDRIGDQMDASLDILFLAHQHDFWIDEVGVTVEYDVDNASSYNPVFHGYQLFSTALKTMERERPILSLGFPGLFASVGGVGVGLFTLQHYVRTGELSLGLVIFAAVATLVGIFACFTAVVLHAMNAFTSMRT